MNKILSFSLACILTLACSSTKTPIAQNKPNIVVIMADDIGLGDIGFYHQERTGQKPLVPTPNIDQLINEGMRFSDAHSPASLCAPTRFSMLTGNYPCRNTDKEWGVWRPVDDAGIEPNFTTVARIAKKGGYHTAFLGKWGLGHEWEGWPKDLSGYEQMDKGARYYGFDYALELPQGIQNIPYAFYENGQFMKLKPDSKIAKIPFEQLKYHSEKKRKEGGSVADSNWDSTLAGPILASKAVAYINEQAKDKKPFYMYYCSQAVHVPHTPPAELNGNKIAGTTLGRHGDMVKELDAQVGMIIKALKKNNLYKNTLLVFTSDNGGLNNDKALTDAGHDSSNGLRAKKGAIEEGGHRVPFVARWSNIIKPKTKSDVSIVGLDLVATIATIAGVPVDRTKVFDSANLLPVFKNNSREPLHKYLLHKSAANNGPFYALRQGDWKLIMKGESKKILGELTSIALYNLKENIIEDPSKNLISNLAYKGKIEKMKSQYVELWKGRESTIW